MPRLQTRKQSNTTNRFHTIPDTDKGRGVRAPALRSCYGQPVPILQNHFLNAKFFTQPRNPRRLNADEGLLIINSPEARHTRMRIRWDADAGLVRRPCTLNTCNTYRNGSPMRAHAQYV